MERAPLPDVATTNIVKAADPGPPEGSDQQTSVETPSNHNGNGVQTTVLICLLVLALFFTLHAFGVFFLPLFMAVLFDLLLTPAVRSLKKIGLPEPAGAAVILLLALGAVGYGVYRLTGPASEWAAEAPQKIARTRDRLREVLKPVEAVRRTAEQVERATDTGVTPNEKPKPTVQIEEKSGVSRLFGSTQAFLVGLFEMLVLLYFLLAAGSLFTQKLVKVLPRLRDKKKAVEIAREVEASVSRYLVTLAGINVVEGAIVTAAMWAIGMPNPPLWGALTALLIFIPYIGALTMGAILLVVGVTTFDSVGHALAAPGLFALIDIVQANFISPHVLGNRMTLNPVAIFVSILLWGHIWGVAGVLIAVPLAVVLKIFCDHVEGLTPVGEFLGK